MVGLKFSPAVGWAISLPAGSILTTVTPLVIALHDCREVAYTVTGTGIVTGGIVVLESSDEASYSGTWFEIDRIDFSSQSLTNAKWQAPPYPAGLGGFYRLRIAGDVTGGGSIKGAINGLLQ